MLENKLTDETIIELLKSRVQNTPNKDLYTFLKDEHDENTLTYAELDQYARVIGAKLQKDLKIGDRAILLFPAGLEFIKTFFACLYAGIIAIPLPMPTSKQTSLSFLKRVIENAGASAIISSSYANRSLNLAEHINNIKLIDFDQLNELITTDWLPVAAKKEDIAFLQYTSGSTGSPKGVMVSHANLLHNQTLMKVSFDTRAGSVFVTWLPHYHDMGLIGTILHPLYIGCKMVFMAPMSFLQKPFRWLQAISKYRGTVSGAPNFAYELCAARITEEQKKELDLSSWTLAFNGAEKVRLETLEKFAALFAECGFKKQSFCPTYGLAEGTLFATGGKFKTGFTYASVDKKALESNAVIPVEPENHASLKIVSLGSAWLDQKVVTVNPQTLHLCTDDQVGEIWLKGPSVAQGYWNNPEKTKEQFQAKLATGEGPFFRTGDLGFIQEGNLFVTGRIKDLIIIRGRNLYPDDIESAIQVTDTALKIAGGAAFSVDIDNQEQLVLVQEVERVALKRLNAEVICKNISTEIFKKFYINIHTIMLIMPHTLPKTTSGKVRRQQIKSMFLQGSIEAIAHKSLSNLTLSINNISHAA